MGVFGNSYESSYFDHSATSGNGYLHLPNVGLVFSSENKNRTGRKQVNGWVRTNFGIGLNRISNYRSDLRYEGINPHNSMMTKYVEDLSSGSGTNPGDVYSTYPYSAGLAYETFMIDPLEDDTMSYTSKIPYGGALQAKDIDARGRFNEWVFSLGGNYNDKLYLGATLGIPTLNYREEVVFSENDVQDTIGNFNEYAYSTILNAEATGINFKVGMIYWVNKYLRVGGAIHSPTLLSFEETYRAEMESDLENGETYEYETPSGSFAYQLITPWRGMASIAFMLGKYGFVSAEYEYYNPGSARYRFNEGGSKSYESELNNNISTKYGGVNKLRLGTELVLDDFRLRGGLRYATTVFNDAELPDKGGDHEQFGYSLGAGFVGKWFFLDAAFQTTLTDFADVPYTLQDPNQTVGGALIDWQKYNVQLTAGVKF
jgi:hypothetical protein